MKQDPLKKLRSFLLPHLPDHLLGKPEVFAKLYHGRSMESRILHHKEKTAQAYLLLVLVCLLCIVISWICAINTKAHHVILERPELGDTPLRKTVEAIVIQGESRVKRSLSMMLYGYGRSAVDVQQYLDKLLDGLPVQIAGKNKDLRSIEYPLELPVTVGNEGANIAWISSSPLILDETGSIDWLKIDREQTITLTAAVSMGEVVRERSYELTIPPPSKERVQESIAKSLEDALDQVRKDAASGGEIHLPAQTADGTPITWMEKRSNLTGSFLLLFLMGALLIYARRYEGAKREMLRERKRIERDLPEFVDALVLMLYAGSYTEGAIKRIATNYEAGTDSKGEYPLHEQIRSIRDHLEQSNVSLRHELISLAEQCNLRELSRIITILTDNLEKGIALAEKLDMESSMLRYGRKRKSKEAGQLIETKLTFPMVLLLISLLIITTGPVMIGL
ncbi:MAG: hypothetical protein CVU86_05420 [Firmicutes bacterium HGW-Firmicutes-11]|jgi:hypothetical protein|nr:MAG: hypothetical protein CVU86_05420 [Firmicutes bacterium HGW-Firmicutes-11]